MQKQLKALVPTCDAIANLLHPSVEVVLHDLTDGTIAYIANAYSKRRIGDSSLIDSDPDIDLSQDVMGPYAKINWDGRRLKSVSSLIKDGRGRKVGILCVNLDIEDFAGALDQLRTLITLPDSSDRPTALFSKDWREGINDALATYLANNNVTLSGLKRNDIDELLLFFEREGVFEIRKAVPYVAELLKLSRATIYNRLSAIRGKQTVNA